MFKDSTGKISSVRVMSFLSFFIASLFGYLTLSSPTPVQDGSMITFGFLVAAFAPKVVQKFAEDKVK